MNEYKKFFKQAEHNHRVNGVRVGIQNPLEKMLAEHELERKLNNQVDQHFSSHSNGHSNGHHKRQSHSHPKANSKVGSKSNSRSRSNSHSTNHSKSKSAKNKNEQDRMNLLAMKGMRVADIEKSLGKGSLRLVKRNESQNAAPSRIPMKTLGILTVGFALCLWSLIEPEGLSHVMKSVEINAFGSAHAESQEHTKNTAAKSSEALNPKRDLSSQTPAQAKPISAQEVRQWTDEELSFFNDLNKRKEDLEKKEKDLAQLEAELQKRQGEIEQKIKDLEKTRGQIANVLQDRVKTDEERVDKLVQFYSSMKPTNAARIISSLDEGLAITILNKMKKQDAAAILNFIDPMRAKEISEKFAGYSKN